MRVSMIGCGRLGYPVALAWATKHEVVGYDVSPHAREITASRKYPHLEPGAQKLLDEGVQVPIVDSVDEAVAHGDIVFLAVQTPHRPEYEGVTRMPAERADFDYAALCRAVREVAESAERQKKFVIISVISTVLPGTSEREILPIIAGNKYVSYTYQPMFIAQSTVVEDALNPEFVLLGVDKAEARAIEYVREFFESFHSPEKLRFMSVTSAELTKVGYNVLLGLKLVAANSIMEIAHKTGANCDDVMNSLMKATDRLISSKYYRPGMGDGGGCHSRDAIALSWLARERDLSFDLFGAMIRAREEQTLWLARLALVESTSRDNLPIVILGKAYKKGTNLTVGSPAILLKKLLEEEITAAAIATCGNSAVSVTQWDPHVDGPNLLDGAILVKEPSVFLIGTEHDEFFSIRFASGSVVIDPWGKMRDQEGVRVVRVGRQ